MHTWHARRRAERKNGAGVAGGRRRGAYFRSLSVTVPVELCFIIYSARKRSPVPPCAAAASHHARPRHCRVCRRAGRALRCASCLGLGRSGQAGTPASHAPPLTCPAAFPRKDAIPRPLWPTALTLCPPPSPPCALLHTPNVFPSLLPLACGSTSTRVATRARASGASERREIPSRSRKVRLCVCWGTVAGTDRGCCFFLLCAQGVVVCLLRGARANLGVRALSSPPPPPTRPLRSYVLPRGGCDVGGTYPAEP